MDQIYSSLAKKLNTFLSLATMMLILPGLSAQDFQDTGNEPHAFVRARPVIKPAYYQGQDNAVFTNTNLTNQIAPQNEPSVRISRSNPDIVVAAWRDFRLGYLEPDIERRIGYSYSHDGGLTWSESQLLPDPNPGHNSQSDPVVTSDAEGHFYISSTSRQPVPNYNRQMLLYKSVDNGQSFQLHDIAAPGSGGAGEDKEWLICDPVEDNATFNQLMMVWRSFGPSNGIKFTKSDVGGSNWTPALAVSDYPSGQGANIATGTEGQIYVTWRDGGILFDVSYDGGESFGDDTWITGYDYDNNSTFPYICVDYTALPSRGNVYVVWADTRQGNGDDVWFQRSEDGGLSWMTNPVRVNSFTAYDQFWPVIQCTPTGRLVVTYYDEHDFPGLLNAYLAYSDDQGNTWTNIRLSDISFYGSTPNSDVRFGDYIGIDAFGQKIIPVWTDDRTGDDNQEIYMAVVDIQVMIDEFTQPGKTATLHQNFPNPFSRSTDIPFYLNTEGKVELAIYNMLGEKVADVFSGNLETGYHQFTYDGNIPAGIYVVRMNAAGYHESRLITRM